MDSNSKRIAKNTLFLYLRMGLLMFISLFTSRVLLDKLGVEDFGVYNVIGGMAAGKIIDTILKESNSLAGDIVEGAGTAPEPELKVMTGRKLAVAAELGGVIGARVAQEAGLRR